MKNPGHPGEMVRHECLEPLGLTITEGAKVLGVPRLTLSKLVNGKSGVSAADGCAAAQGFRRHAGFLDAVADETTALHG